jgi:hypothetical protein
MSEKAKIKKANQLVFGVTMEASIKNGPLFILINLQMKEQKDSIRNLASISTDHSTLDQECQ